MSGEVLATLITTTGVVVVALIGAAVQLRGLRSQNTAQHSENKNAVEQGFQRIHERLDQGDRRFDRIETRIEEMDRKPRWRR